MSNNKVNNTDLVHYHLEPTEQEIKKSHELYEKYKETKKISYLKKAIKKNYLLLFNDKNIQTEIMRLRYYAIRPILNKETLDARKFFDGLLYLKPDKTTEMAFNFGSEYRMESCLGMNFKSSVKWQLIAINETVFLYYVNRLITLWKEFTNTIGKKRFGNDKPKYIIDFCKSNDIEISEDDLDDWGSISQISHIALTIIGILNLKRFKLAYNKISTFGLRDLLGNYPYFKFDALYKYYKEIDKKMKIPAKKNREIIEKIKEAEKKENEFVIHQFKMAYHVHIITHHTLVKKAT